jgi:hypothetical protein
MVDPSPESGLQYPILPLVNKRWGQLCDLHQGFTIIRQVPDSPNHFKSPSFEIVNDTDPVVEPAGILKFFRDQGTGFVQLDCDLGPEDGQITIVHEYDMSTQTITKTRFEKSQEPKKKISPQALPKQIANFMFAPWGLTTQQNAGIFDATFVPEDAPQPLSHDTARLTDGARGLFSPHNEESDQMPTHVIGEISPNRDSQGNLEIDFTCQVEQLFSNKLGRYNRTFTRDIIFNALNITAPNALSSLSPILGGRFLNTTEVPVICWNAKKKVTKANNTLESDLKRALALILEVEQRNNPYSGGLAGL